MALESFREKIKLDIMALEKAALDQPSLYAEYGELWAQSLLDRDRAKEALSAKKTEVDESVRNDPDKYGLIPGQKPTETWIANKITQHEEVIVLTEEVNKAQYNVGIMSVAKEALDHRLKAISILTELYKGNYYSASARSSEIYKKAVESLEEEQRQNIEDSPEMKRLIAKKKGENHVG
jgi:hypothetical protein